MTKDEDRFQHKRIESKKCKLDDFMAAYEHRDDKGVQNVKQIKKLFNDWEGSAIICPSLETLGSFELQGDQSSMTSKHFQFSINMCDPSTRRPE